MADFDRIRHIIAGEAPITWVATGDSITHGLQHTNGSRSYVEHFHEVLRSDLGRFRDVVINTAISGHRITDILGDFDHRVIRWSPQIVTLMVGTNDCAEIDGAPYATPEGFGAGVAQFVAAVRGSGAVPVLQTPPPVDVPNAANRARVGEFAAAVRAVAEESGAMLVDHHAYFLALGGERFPWPLLDDPFHPGALGHGAIALELTRVLGIDQDTRALAALRGSLLYRGLSAPAH